MNWRRGLTLAALELVVFIGGGLTMLAGIHWLKDSGLAWLGYGLLGMVVVFVLAANAIRYGRKQP